MKPGAGTPHLRLWMYDGGVDAQIVPWQDHHVLIVRPGQSFDSAVAAVKAAAAASRLDLDDRAVRALLRPHFPADTNLSSEHLGEPDGAALVWAKVIRADRRQRIVYWSLSMTVAALVGVLVAWFATTGPLPATAQTTPPLHTAKMAALMDAFGVRCVTNDGWTAACSTPEAGAAQFSAWYSPDGILLHLQAGQSSTGFLIADDRESADLHAARFAHRAWIAPAGDDVVRLQSDDYDVLMWGPPQVLPPAVEVIRQRIGADVVPLDR